MIHQIAEISALRDELEEAVRVLREGNGDPSEAVSLARSLEAAARALKQELVRNYLECRISMAARAITALNN
jgi:hypothetical protein